MGVDQARRMREWLRRFDGAPKISRAAVEADATTERQPMPTTFERTATALRAAAMTYPEAHEDFPWGEVAVKVKKKVFLFLHCSAETLSLSCKLPQSSDMALMLPFARPTGYGLGKSGWVSAKFENKDQPPVDLLREWIDESYRAVAPKKLVAALVSGGGAAAADEKGVAKKAAAGKKTAKAASGAAGKKTAKVAAAGKKTGRRG